MRKFFIPLLLASAFAPASASAREGGFLDAMRAKAEQSQRSDQSESRPQRVERVESDNRADRPARNDRIERVRADRPARAERIERPVQVEQNVQAESPVQEVRQDRIERIRRRDRPDRVRPVEGNVQPVEQAHVPDAVLPVQQDEAEQRNGGRVDSLVDAYREIGRNPQYDRDRRDGDRRDRRRDRRDGDRDWRDGDRDWRRDWRRDSRYDWWGYRNRYGSLYRLGRYHDPYGWGYRRWSIGYSLWPSYYGSNYWLNEPWSYRLPPAYGPYRWIRYYDDALLVNTYTGEVVDVIHNFFW